jgi:hypothetical protein
MNIYKAQTNSPPTAMTTACDIEVLLKDCSRSIEVRKPNGITIGVYVRIDTAQRPVAA